MPGDEFKKVRPGDPLKIPARTYNALLDVARGHKERGLMFAGGSVGQRLRSCTVVAYNYQIQNAPRGAVVQLRGRIITSAQVEFCRPTGSGEIYGIALEPIRLSHMGLIAISGGPWKIKTNVGMRLAPVADSWVAAQGSGPWQCIEDVSGGYCRVVFSTGTGLSPLARADAQMVQDNTLYAISLLNTDGSVADTAQACRPPGLWIRSGTLGVLGRSGGGAYVLFPVTDSAGYPGTTIGTTVESDAPDTTSWTRAFGPMGSTMTLRKLYRISYMAQGAQRLYGFYRDETFDDIGLYNVSGETAVIIDTPGAC